MKEFEKLLAALKGEHENLVIDPVRSEHADKEDVLKAIRQIESSGGQNTNHRVMESGIHAGEHAIGDYAIMPKTAAEIIKHHPKLAEEAEELHDPSIQKHFASAYYDDIAKHVGKAPEEIGYGWNRGVNAAKKQKTLYEHGVGKPLSSTEYNQKLLKLLK